MRIPRALSFTSLKLANQNPERFYLEKLADHRSNAFVQTKPMAAGSGADTVIKSHLAFDLWGVVPAELEIETVYYRQVDPSHQAWALEAGYKILEAYKISGAYDELLAQLRASETQPRFESGRSAVIGGVPLYGLPDLSFTIGCQVIDDWKVRGYFSPASPTPGYRICRDGWIGKPSRSNGKTHKRHGSPLNEISQDYAAQTTIYAWLCGIEPGDENWLARINEFCGPPPKVRVAALEGFVEKHFQLGLLTQAQALWERITSGHFFPEMSRTESQDRCGMLDEMAKAVPQASLDNSLDAQLARLEATYRQEAA